MGEDYEIGISIIEGLEELRVDIAERQTETAQAVYDANEAGKNNSFILSIAAILIGIAIAVFIVYRLVRTLKTMAEYTVKLSQGDFEATLDVNEPGEIGEVSEALRQVPEVLNDIVATYGTLQTQIENGMLNAQADPGQYMGAFSDIVAGTNSIIDRMRMLIDDIPTPVVMLNRGLKATYLNSMARDFAGDDYQDKGIDVLFATQDYGTRECALQMSVEAMEPRTTETGAHPPAYDQDMEITYTSIPLTDTQGKLSSILLLITDLTEIKETQRIIMDTVDQSTEIADRVAAASEQLAAQMQQLSSGAEVQRDRVASTATAMEEMNATVMDVARNAGQAREQSDLARDKAEEGSRVVEDVVKLINQINEVSLALEVDMRELGEKADEVGNVMNVIADIADQTNLLALNAAIEAARAGEAGRGFAVVADEVRTLAENTMNATTEVGIVVRDIQEATSKNIENVGVAVENIGTANEEAHGAGLALHEIVDLVTEAAHLITGIATASEEQSAASEEINQAIDEVNLIVRESTEAVGESTSAIDELARTAIQLKRVLDQLTN